MESLNRYLNVCEHASREGGRVLMEWFGRIRATEKAPKDLVTEADLASQDTIQAILLGEFPDHGFLGEEGGFADDNHPTYRWIVDPLDGTTNYVHQLPSFSTSIALERNGELIVGTVFDPNNGECFSAIRGAGAFLNGRSIRTSQCRQLREALVAASFSTNVQRSSPEVERFLAVLTDCQALRRMGSAALNLAYVASGRLDAYWATSVKAWDVAAGALLVREAGAILTSLDGGKLDISDPKFAVSATESLHGELLSKLRL